MCARYCLAAFAAAAATNLLFSFDEFRRRWAREGTGKEGRGWGRSLASLSQQLRRPLLFTLGRILLCRIRSNLTHSLAPSCPPSPRSRSLSAHAFSLDVDCLVTPSPSLSLDPLPMKIFFCGRLQLVRTEPQLASTFRPVRFVDISHFQRPGT